MKITIHGFKNIINPTTIEIDSKKINTLIGSNGVGKSNLLQGINYFKKSIDNSDVQVTSNFEGNEQELIETKSVKIEYELSEKEKGDVIEELKKIKIPVTFMSNIDLISTNIKNQKGIIQDSDSLYIIYEEIFNKKSDIIGDKYFTFENNRYYPNFDNIEKAIANKSLPNKLVIIPILECIINIREIFSKQISIFFIDSASNEFDLQHKTDIMDLNDPDKSKKIIELLYFIGYKALQEAKNIYKMASNSSLDTNKSEISKKRIIDWANEKIISIFDFFQLYGTPNFSINQTSITLSINFDKKVKFGEPTELKSNSDGFKSILHFIKKFEYALEYSKYNNEKIILIADELDKNIHPLIQFQLLDYIKERIKDSNIYLIISTHSPFLIELNNEVCNFYIVSKEEDGSLKISEKNNLKNEEVSSSFLVLAKKTLDNHEFISNLGKKRVIILESTLNDDIAILKAKINKKIENVHYCLMNEKEDFIISDISSIIKNVQTLNEIEEMLEDNQKIYISKEVLDIIREEV
ncbi:hypothetical protein CK556_01740 [Mesoplasma chauliocola]|uniref:Endonuclease GajA/Old nuclease/RecF-like AAA domain-containing protein n=1 Tax=Mesoplasma chauliocola TaxID=216427 RepID=A0A249SN99_9MOLU|nr:AAA family ATPase [Mesoplasma chauliocola]ASZ09077.1 hypothetical protein CK556_01740 [Mesoplasma chauliocola]